MWVFFSVHNKSIRKERKQEVFDNIFNARQSLKKLQKYEICAFQNAVFVEIY